MDIGIQLFMVEDEFSSFIELARSKGHDVIFDERWKQWTRIDASQPLPKTFRDRLRERSNGSHRIYLCVDDPTRESDPSKVSPPNLVCAYFGGLSGDKLYQTRITMRSNHLPTIKFVKSARTWLHSMSRTGVDVVSLPDDDGERRRDRGIRFTEGARSAVDRGAVLRQGGVKNVGFEISGIRR